MFRAFRSAPFFFSGIVTDFPSDSSRSGYHVKKKKKKIGINNIKNLFAGSLRVPALATLSPFVPGSIGNNFSLGRSSLVHHRFRSDKRFFPPLSPFLEPFFWRFGGGFNFGSQNNKNYYWKIKETADITIFSDTFFFLTGRLQRLFTFVQASEP